MRMEEKPDASPLGLKANPVYFLRGVLSGLGAFSILMLSLGLVTLSPPMLPLGLIKILIALVITCAIYPGRYRVYAKKHRDRLAKLDAHIETVNSTVSQPTQGLRTPSKQHGPAQRSWFYKVATVTTTLSILGTALFLVFSFLAHEAVLHDGNEKKFRQYNKVGVRYSRDKRYDEAVAAFTKATQVDALRPRSFLNRAVVYLKQGKWREAILDCSKVIDLLEHGDVDSDIKLEKVYYFRGVANHKSGNNEQAIKDWATVMRLNPFAVKSTTARERLVQRLGRSGQEAPNLALAVSSRQSITNKARDVARFHSQSHTPRVGNLNRQAPPTTERFEVHGEHLAFEVPDGFSRLELGSVEFDDFRKITPPNVELLRVFIENDDQSRLRRGERMLGHRTISIKTMAAPPIENYTLKHFDQFAAVIRDVGPESLLAAGLATSGATMSHGMIRHPKSNWQEEVIQFDTARYRDDCFLVTGVTKLSHSRGMTPSATWRSYAFAFCLRKGKIMEINVTKENQQHSRTDLEWATRSVKRYIENLG